MECHVLDLGGRQDALEGEGGLHGGQGYARRCPGCRGKAVGQHLCTICWGVGGPGAVREAPAARAGADEEEEGCACKGPRLERVLGPLRPGLRPALPVPEGGPPQAPSQECCQGGHQTVGGTRSLGLPPRAAGPDAEAGGVPGGRPGRQVEVCPHAPGRVRAGGAPGGGAEPHRAWSWPPPRDLCHSAASASQAAPCAGEEPAGGLPGPSTDRGDH
mmetsp:Transcript_8702/g.29910  ORF Transcript_8702/g.29910 Transcript_8702/m.29910 type:complete len:216 (-) Transcript_8702:3474-4121(-)